MRLAVRQNLPFCTLLFILGLALIRLTNQERLLESPGMKPPWELAEWWSPLLVTSTASVCHYSFTSFALKRPYLLYGPVHHPVGLSPWAATAFGLAVSGAFS